MSWHPLLTLALGIVHFFFPRLLDFEGALPKEGPPLLGIGLAP